jgi:hypothetical protein
LRKITKILLRPSLRQAYRIIEQKEKTKLARARKIASSLRDLVIPHVKESVIPPKKLQLRYNKLVVRLRERIELNLPIVFSTRLVSGVK